MQTVKENFFRRTLVGVVLWAAFAPGAEEALPQEAAPQETFPQEAPPREKTEKEPPRWVHPLLDQAAAQAARAEAAAQAAKDPVAKIVAEVLKALEPKIKDAVKEAVGKTGSPWEQARPWPDVLFEPATRAQPTPYHDLFLNRGFPGRRDDLLGEARRSPPGGGAHLDLVQLASSLADAAGDLTISKHRHLRMEELRKNQAASEEESITARARHESAEAKVKVLRRMARAALGAARAEVSRLVSEMEETHALPPGGDPLARSSRLRAIESELEAAKANVEMLESILLIAAETETSEPRKR
jgi:hypothetical protein